MKDGLRERAVAVCGLIFVWTVSRANFFGHLIMFGMSNISDEILYYGIWLAAVFLVALLIANDKTLSTLVTFGKRKWFPVALGLSLSTGCLLLAICVDSDVLFPWLIIIGGLLSSIGMLGLFPLWGYYLTHKKRMTIFMLMLGSMAASCVITILLNLIPKGKYEVVMSLLAVMPGICYALLPRQIEKEELSEGEATRDISLVPGKPVSTVLALFSFMIVGTLVKGRSLVDGGFAFSDAFTLTVMISVLGYIAIAIAAMRIWHGKQHIGFFCIVLMVAYLICLALYIGWPELLVVDGIVMATRYFLNFFFVLLLVLFTRAGKIKPKTAVGLFAAGQLIGAALAYCIVPFLIISTAIDQNAVNWIALILMIVDSGVVIVLLMKSRIEMETAAATKTVTSEQLQQIHFARFLKRHNLTEKEGEILKLLAQGGTRQSIADELYNSPSTIASHTGKIYKKLGCHSKREAIAILSDEMQKAADERHQNNSPRKIPNK